MQFSLFPVLIFFFLLLVVVICMSMFFPIFTQWICCVGIGEPVILNLWKFLSFYMKVKIQHWIQRVEWKWGEIVFVLVLVCNNKERESEREELFVCRDWENRKKGKQFSITGKWGKRNIDFQKTFPSAFNVFPIIFSFFRTHYQTHTNAHFSDRNVIVVECNFNTFRFSSNHWHFQGHFPLRQMFFILTVVFCKNKIFKKINL